MNYLAVAAVAATTIMTVQADNLDTSFKAYMDYKYITNTHSIQYELQQDAWTDSNGLRRYGDDYMVAVSYHYGEVGDRIKVTLDTGEVFNATIGDSKGDVWYHPCGKGACVVEFIVDTPYLDKMVTKMGDCSYVSDFFEGGVISIQKLTVEDC